LQNVIDLREGEARPAAQAFFTLFFTIAAHTILETARDALFLSKLPARELNVVYIVIAGLTFVVGAIAAHTALRFGERTALLASIVVAAVVTTFLHFLSPTPRVALVLYVFSGLLGASLVPQFWLLAARMFTASQGRRLFGVFAASGTLGGVAGAGAAALVLRVTSITTLLLVSSVLLVCAALVCATITLDDAARPPPSVGRTKTGALFRETPFLKNVATAVALGTAAVFVLDYLFKSTVARVVPAASLGTFFAWAYAAMNVLSLVVQLLLSTRLLRRLGVIGAVAVLPMLLVLGSGAVLASGGALAFVLVPKAFDGGLRYSLNRTGTELLYLPIPREARERGKALIDGVITRLAQAAIAALLYALATHNLAGPNVLAVFIVVLASSWLFAIVISRGRYLDLFRRALASGNLGASATDAELDLASAETLVEAMASADPVQVVAAMNLLDQKKHGKLIPALILHHSSPAVLTRALDIFAASDRSDWIALAEGLMSHANVDVRIAALRALSKHNVVEAIERAVDDVSSRVQAYAALHVALRGEELDLVDHPLIAVLLKTPGDFGIASRKALLWAIADTPTPKAVSVLLALAGDAQVLAEPAEVTHLAHAMAALADDRFIPILIARLTMRAGREAVRDALVKIGDRAFDALVRTMGESKDVRLRVHLPRTLGHFGNERAGEALLDQLAMEKDGLVRYKVLRGLGLLVGHVRLDSTRLESAAQKNLLDHVQILAHRVSLAGSRAGLASPNVVGEDALDLLVGLLDDKLDQSLERTFRLLKLAHPREDMHRVYNAARGGDRTARANAIEYLDALLWRAPQQSLRELLRIVLDQIDDRERVTRARDYASTILHTRDDALTSLIDDHDDAIAMLATQAALSVASTRAVAERALRMRPALAALGARWFGTEAHGA
jgi:MFS family permease